MDLSCSPPQKPFAEMSNLALSSLFAVARWSCSPERGCNLGSMQTSVQTSDNNSAAMSLTSLWLKVGKPPLAIETTREI